MALTSKVKPIPDTYRRVKPALTVTAAFVPSLFPGSASGLWVLDGRTAGRNWGPRGAAEDRREIAPTESASAPDAVRPDAGPARSSAPRRNRPGARGTERPRRLDGRRVSRALDHPHRQACPGVRA